MAPNNNFTEPIFWIIAPCYLNIENSQILNDFLRFSIRLEINFYMRELFF